MSLEEVIFDACMSRATQYFYVGENIPNRKLRNVWNEYSVGQDEVVYALVDSTVFGSAKEGVAITNKGIHINNSWTSDLRKGFIGWEDFLYSEFDYNEKFSSEAVWIDNLHIGMSGCSLKPKALYQTFLYIQQRIREFTNVDISSSEYKQPAAPPLPTKEAWMVAIDGTQYGPYDEQTIIGMLQSSQLDENSHYVWKQGMANWELVKDCAPFNSHRPPAAPPLPIQTAETKQEEYSVIDVNSAVLSDFLSLPAVTLERANALLLKRKELGGSFRSIEQVQDVLDLNPHEFERIRPYLTISLPTKEVNKMGGRVIDF